MPDNNPFPIDSSDIHDIVCSFLPRADILALYQTSRWNQHRTQNSLKAQQAIEIITKHAGESFGQFLPLPDINPVNLDECLSEAVLRAVVLGNEELVLALLKLHPEALLDDTQSATDYRGRIVTDSPLAAMIRDGDTDMLKAVQPYLEQVAGGETEAYAIFKSVMDEIFPKGLNEHLELQKRNAFNFKPILEAISNASEEDIKFALDNPGQDNGSPLCKALNYFRASFAKTALEELVFNPEHFLAALQTYIDKFDKIEKRDPNWHKRDLFCRQVIGFIQRYFSACYMQAIAQGIFQIVEGEEPLARRFSFRYTQSTSLIPLTSCSGLGFNYYGVVDGARPHFALWPDADALQPLPMFGKIMSNKNTSLAEIYTDGAQASQNTRRALLPSPVK